MIKLAIVTTHPIQYYAPIFQLLAQSPGVDVKVFYTWNQQDNYDPGFGKEIRWDIPLLEGYNYTFVDNIAKEPGSHHFRGIINPTLNKEIAQWGARALLVFGWSYQSHLAAMRYFKGKIPVFFRGDSHLLNEKLSIKVIARRIFLRWVYKHIDYAFYVGENNKSYYKVHGLSDSQLIFAPHAIDNTRFNSNKEELHNKALEWRQSLGIATEDIVFLFVGKLEPQKNPFLLLKAFISLNPTNKHLIFVGNGILEQSLTSLAKPYSNVHFINFQNQSVMPLVYKLGNVYVLPSLSETWGLAVNEAMVCGLPVLVSSKVGCAADLVEEAKNGYIFESDSLEDLVAKLKLFDKDPEFLNNMGTHSADIIANYSFKKIVSQITNTLHKVVEIL